MCIVLFQLLPDGTLQGTVCGRGMQGEHSVPPGCLLRRSVHVSLCVSELACYKWPSPIRAHQNHRATACLKKQLSTKGMYS